MFQDIGEHRLDNSYAVRTVQPSDYLLCLNDRGEVLMFEGGSEGGLGDGEGGGSEGGSDSEGDGSDSEGPSSDQAPSGSAWPGIVSTAVLPTYGKAHEALGLKEDGLQYLCTIDTTAFFLAEEFSAPEEPFGFHGIMAFRMLQPDWLAFAGATAMHLAHWYQNNRFCGRCSREMERGTTERSLVCPHCGLTVYPRINPVVIVGITNGDELLLTKYSRGAYRRHALVAGFMEIGETFEDTVRREVMEEVGLQVRNIRYYKSQPWAFSESVLAGYFADVEGSNTPCLNDHELEEAIWYNRADIPREDSNFSLTWDMIERFRTGAV
jgi:NAD+ diphosphatase